MPRNAGKELVRSMAGRSGVSSAVVRDASPAQRKLDEREVLQAALKESQRRFEDISELGDDWIWETDAALRLTFISSAGLRALQLSEEDVYGVERKEIARLRPISTPIALRRQHLSDLKHHRPIKNFEYAITRPDGSVVHVQTNAKPIHDDSGKFIGYRGFSKDITAWREAATRLATSEQRARAFLDATSDYAVLVDRKFVITDINQGMAARFGKPVEDLIGVPLADCLDPHVVAHRISYLRQVLKWGEGLEFNDYHRGRWVKSRYTPIADGAGKITHVAIFVRDVTNEKEAEHALVMAKETAENASHAKSRFLGNISHELRTPLNAIIGFAETMQAEIFGPIGVTKYREYVDDIAKSANLLLGVIGDLLDISAIEQGRMRLEEEEIDPASVVNAAIRMVAARAGEKNIRIVTDFGSRAPVLKADDRRLKQVLLNVLINAIKFTPDQGDIRITGTVGAGGGYELRVTDSGVGMTTEEIETAMTPFGRIDDDVSGHAEGTGLGLPVSASIMEAHGGDLRLISTPKHGTQVLLTFPAGRVL